MKLARRKSAKPSLMSAHEPAFREVIVHKDWLSLLQHDGENRKLAGF